SCLAISSQTPTFPKQIMEMQDQPDTTISCAIRLLSLRGTPTTALLSDKVPPQPVPAMQVAIAAIQSQEPLDRLLSRVAAARPAVQRSGRCLMKLRLRCPHIYRCLIPERTFRR